MGWATSSNTIPWPLTVASFTKAISEPPLVAKRKCAIRSIKRTPGLWIAFSSYI